MHITSLKNSEFFRFIVTGIINTANAYAVFALLILFGAHYTIATLVGGASSVILSFFLMSRYVFRVKSHGRFFPFVMLFGILYLINIFTQFILHRLGLDNDYIAGAIGLFVSVVLSFTANKGLIFRKPGDQA